MFNTFVSLLSGHTSYFNVVRKSICFFTILTQRCTSVNIAYTSSHMNILRRLRLFKFVSFRVFKIRIYTFRIDSRDTSNIYLNSGHSVYRLQSHCSQTFKHLYTNINLNFIYSFSSYLTVNTVLLCYKSQSDNAI
jgi:hypothetical protein